MNEVISIRSAQPNALQQKSTEMHDLNFWWNWLEEVRQSGTTMPYAKELAETAREGLEIIERQVELAEQTARPATAEEILFELELLESRYHRADHDPATAKALARQWVKDILELEVSIGDLRDCCKRWRVSKEAFAPRSPGQLLGDKFRSHKSSLSLWRRVRKSAVDLAGKAAA